MAYEVKAISGKEFVEWLRDHPDTAPLMKRIEELEAERDQLQTQNKNLGDMVHKRGNDIAMLKHEVKRLTREAHGG